MGLEHWVNAVALPEFFSFFRLNRWGVMDLGVQGEKCMLCEEVPCKAGPEMRGRNVIVTHSQMLCHDVHFRFKTGRM